MPRRTPKIAKEIVGSPEQLDIWKSMKSSVEHLIIEALAGTGKTTTIVEGAKKLPRGLRVGFCAFNKSAQRDLKKRLPINIDSFTTHSLGRQIIVQNLGRVTFDRDKNFNLMDDLKEQFHLSKWPKGLRYRVSNLVRLAKSEGLLVPKSKTAKQKLYEASEHLNKIIDHYGIDLGEHSQIAVDMTLSVLRDCIKHPTVIDFDDMIYIPHVLGLSLPRPYDLLMVDEAQDLNSTQIELALRSGDRLIVVGDRHQSIYGWRGADTEAMPRFESTLSKTERGLKVFPLTVCRRCPTTVIELAQQLVPAIQPLPTAPIGSIQTISSDEAHELLSPGDMVISRINAPLVSLCYALWADKKKAIFVGRDFGREIISLINGFDLKELADLYPCLRSYYHEQSQRITERYGEDLLDYYMTAVQDKITCIQDIANRCKNLAGFMQELKDLFHVDMTDEEEESIDYTKIIRLSSIHRAKGSEAPRVFILAPEKLPLGKASTDWQITEERNLGYVAVTRSQHDLYFIGSTPPLFVDQQIEFNSETDDYE